MRVTRTKIPMLAAAVELDQTLALMEQAKKSLDDEGMPYEYYPRVYTIKIVLTTLARS